MTTVAPAHTVAQRLRHRKPPPRRPRRVVLTPAQYVDKYGPPRGRCSGCLHTKPDEHAAGGPLDRAVLRHIARYADNDAATWGENAWPSVPTIAGDVGCSERSVQYAMRRLERDGFIELVAIGHGTSNLYRVLRQRQLVAVDDDPGSVDNPGENPVSEDAADPASLHPPGATVAPNHQATTRRSTPEAPVRGWEEVDGAARRLNAAPRAPRRGRAPTGTAPPSPAEVGAEPHRRMRGLDAVPNVAAASLESPPAVLSASDSDDPPVERASRWVTRETRRCPRCAAPPGESCRRPNGRLRRANHAERRPPRL